MRIFFTRSRLTTAVLTATCFLAASLAVVAQPPDGPSRSSAVKPDKDVGVWVKVLSTGLIDKNAAIRTSAAEAVLTIGPAALPTLRLLAENDDAKLAEAARSLLARMESRTAQAVRSDESRGQETIKAVQPGSGIQWYATLESGLKEAKRTGRPILLVSAAPHCSGVSGTW